VLDVPDDPDPNPDPKKSPNLTPAGQQRPSTGPRRDSEEDVHQNTMTPNKGRQIKIESPSSEDQKPTHPIPKNFPLSNDDVFFTLKVPKNFP
jgi:hypothetical protein